MLLRVFPLFVVLIAALTPLHAADLPHFIQPTAVWNVDVSHAPLRSNSTAMMTRLETIAASRTGSGKWGGDPNPHNPTAATNIDFQIDMSDFYVLHATNSTPTKAVVAWPSAGDYYTPDCTAPGFQFPVPTGGGIEGTGPPPTYSCGTDDCHMLVSNDTTNVLYEAFNTNSVDASGVHARCALTWDLKKIYPRYGRGEHCTSADGAGFPMAPLMLNADEVWAAAQSGGDIGHAIRFILGNTRMAQGTHVHPSSHGTSATSDTDPNAVPYGSRLRLSALFDITQLKGVTTNAAVRAILRSLQKYGMFLSDGGTVPLSADTDYFTTHKWDDADMNVDSHSLFGINPSNFEVVESGDPISNDGDCTLTPADFIFIDGVDF